VITDPLVVGLLLRGGTDSSLVVSLVWCDGRNWYAGGAV